MSERPEHYKPAAGHDWLLPLYDPLTRLLDRGGAARRKFLEAAQIGASDRVLDVGCGTGTFVVLLKAERPGATVVGLDGDPKALAIARRKASQGGLDIRFDENLAYEMPYAEGSFDRAVSSLVFHHMTTDHKLGSLAEVYRVLAPGGLFLLMDFGPPLTGWNRFIGRFSHHGLSMQDNVEGELPGMLAKVGFLDVEVVDSRPSAVGSMWTYRAHKAETR